MRKVLILVLLLCGQAHANDDIILIGDSISSEEYGWQYVHQQRTGHYIRNDSMEGRRIVDYEIPRDLIPNYLRPSRVVYFLGTNDMMYGDQNVGLRFREHMLILMARGFTVTVIIPPHYTVAPSTVPFVKQVRQAMRGMCDMFDLHCIDLQFALPFLLPMMPDGIHPDIEGHRMLESWINERRVL